MPYTPPDLATMRTRLLRDLRDPSGKVFVQAVVDDFILAGLAELNLERPLEAIYELPNATILNPDRDDLVDVPLHSIWRIEALWTANNAVETITHDDTDVGWPAGWSEYAGKIRMPEGMMDVIETNWTDSTLVLRLYGYDDREIPELGTDDMPFSDLQDEQALRLFVRLQGLRALVDTRALFTQWQADANNSDVSPTQLEAMKSQAYTEWERMRSRIRRQMRTPIERRW